MNEPSKKGERKEKRGAGGGRGRGQLPEMNRLRDRKVEHSHEGNHIKTP